MDPVKKIMLEYRRSIMTPSMIKRGMKYKTPTSRSIENSYRIFLQRMQREINKKAHEVFDPAKKEVLRADSLDDLLSSGLQIMSEILKELFASSVFLNEINKMFGLTSVLNFKRYDKEAYRGLGINALPQNLSNDLKNVWVQNNVNLIKNVNSKQLADLQRLFSDNAFTGIRAKDLEKGIQKIFKGSRNNVALIARDQIGKLDGQLDQLKQTNAGIDGYYWDTAGDERVRAQDQRQHNNYYLWGRPPPGGHPKQKINCRCWARPGIDRALLTKKELQAL